MEDNRNKISKVLGRTDIIAIGFGTIVGWAWVMMTTLWINEAGLGGAVTAFFIGGLIILAVGLTYGELTAALPLAGGEFVFVYRTMGAKMAFVVGWIMILAYVSVAAWEGIALTIAVNYLFQIPSAGLLWEISGEPIYLVKNAIGIVGAVLLSVINYRGIKQAMLFQVMATAVLIIIVLFVFFGGIVFGDLDNIGPAFTSMDGFSYVFLMVPAMLVGFNVIPQSAEEMNISNKNVGKMILVCIIMSICWYMIIIIGTAMAAPVEIRASGIVPMADVTAYLYNGEVFSVIIIAGGILGILTTWNGFFIGGTRLIFAMGRARILPEIFGKVHKKYKTPWAAVLFVGTVCAISPLLGESAFTWFVNTSSMCVLFSYIFVVIAFILLKKKEPNLARPLNVGGTKFGLLILFATIIYFTLYIKENCSFTSINPEFYIVVIWTSMGMLFMSIAKKNNRPVTKEKQELLIFGEKFARRGDQL